MIKEIVVLLVSLLLFAANQPLEQRQRSEAFQEPPQRTTEILHTATSFLRTTIAALQGQLIQSVPDQPIVDVEQRIIEFGKVRIGGTRTLNINLVCIHNDYCWLDGINRYPETPFHVSYVSHPIGTQVPRGSTIQVKVDFQPTSAGSYQDHIILVFCGGRYGLLNGYDVIVIPIDGEVCKLIDDILIGVGVAPPVAVCDVLTTNPRVGDSVSFSSARSYDPDGYIASIRWDFGDGSSSTEADPTHIYQREGTYQVILTVIDDDELESQATCTVTVSGLPILEAAIAGAAGAGITYYILNNPPQPALPAPSEVSPFDLSSLVAVAGEFLFPADQLLVKFKTKMTKQEAERLINQVIAGITIIGSFPPVNAYLIRISHIGALPAIDAKVSELNRIQALLEAQSSVDWVLKNYVGQLEGGHTDLDKLTQNQKSAYTKIHLPQAWESMQQSGIKPQKVKVAVIDSGLDAEHEEFDGFVINGESRLQGKDGKDLPWKEDKCGHGTWVSGIIAAQNGNGGMNGILSGVTDNYELLVYRVTESCDLEAIKDAQALQNLHGYLAKQDSTGKAEQQLQDLAKRIGGTLSHVLVAISQAAQQGAKVVNISMGWYLPDPAVMGRIYDVFEGYMKTYSGILFVTSAGNNKWELTAGSKRHAPGGVIAPNNLTVAALGKDGTKLAEESDWKDETGWIPGMGSNRGEAVDIAAPGVNVYTTTIGGTPEYDFTWGTSVSAPLVTGTAALLLSTDPRLSPTEVKRILTMKTESSSTELVHLNSSQAVTEAIKYKHERDKQILVISSLVGASVFAGVILAGILGLL